MSGYAFTTGLRVVVFPAHGGKLFFGFGDCVTATELDPAAGVLAPVVGPPTGAFVPVAVGFGVEPLLVDVEGDVESLDDVLGAGDVGSIVPIPGDGDTAGATLAQLREVDDPPDGKSWPLTGDWLWAFTLPDPPAAPPPGPVLPPCERCEFALLGKIAC